MVQVPNLLKIFEGDGGAPSFWLDPEKYSQCVAYSAVLSVEEEPAIEAGIN
jgi:hypothetical protein